MTSLENKKSKYIKFSPSLFIIIAFFIYQFVLITVGYYIYLDLLTDLEKYFYTISGGLTILVLFLLMFKDSRKYGLFIGILVLSYSIIMGILINISLAEIFLLIVILTISLEKLI